MIKKYVKKLIPIEVVQWLGFNQSEIREFTKDQVKFVSHWIPVGSPSTMTEEKVDLYVHTLNGDMHANIGDYIIKDTHGEFYPCAQNIFNKSYEVVE